MAAIIVYTVLFLLHKSRASPLVASGDTHINGYCKQFTIPVFATSESAIYDLPRIDNDIEAASWAINADTWNAPAGPMTVLKNTTTSGTFNIHTQLCVPKTAGTNNILQIATHGGHYDSRYWDSQLDPENSSYVEAALKAGYSILTYDRLSTGQSDHPDAYNVAQSPLELEILHQLTLMARNGTLYSLAKQATPVVTVFDALKTPNKVVHVGHSFGSFLTSAFIALYSNLTDGAIITGFLRNQHLGETGMVSFDAAYAATAPFPGPYNRSSGYVACSKHGIQNVFFGGNVSTAFTPEMLDYGDYIKQPIAVGELASSFQILGLPGPDLTAPIQYFLAENDFFVCGGDCKGLANMTVLRETYPKASDIEVYIQPNTGHAFPLHNKASAGFQVSLDFLSSHGL
jgi:pimeloyl-ACP methyl ester carboxylesterase